MKKILITGVNSYVGNAFDSLLNQTPNRHKVEKVSLRDNSWENMYFSNYDVIIFVSGIAHVSSNKKLKNLYYQVNRDLAIDVAQKAKDEGLKQFIFMSSILVYGKAPKNGVIDNNTEPMPDNYYGDSKLQAEERLKTMISKTFKVAILRSPMIYGKECKGNYQRLSGLAKKTPVFPDYYNQRSMLHIDNLCEFLLAIIDNEEEGLFFPQNAEYVKTSELVKLIARIHGKKIIMTKSFNWLINKMLWNVTINKVFGTLIYNHNISVYDKKDYQIRSFKESIKLTEK